MQRSRLGRSLAFDLGLLGRGQTLFLFLDALLNSCTGTRLTLLLFLQICSLTGCEFGVALRLPLAGSLFFGAQDRPGDNPTHRPGLGRSGLRLGLGRSGHNHRFDDRLGLGRLGRHNRLGLFGHDDGLRNGLRKRSGSGLRFGYDLYNRLHHRSGNHRLRLSRLDRNLNDGLHYDRRFHLDSADRLHEFGRSTDRTIGTRRFVTFDESALLADLDLNRAGPPGGVRCTDLTGLFTRQCNFGLARHIAMGTPQKIEKPRFVLLGEQIGFQGLVNASLLQLFEQRGGRHFKLAGKLCNGCLSHLEPPGITRTSARAPW